MISEALTINTTLTILWLISDEIEINENNNKNKYRNMKTNKKECENRIVEREEKMFI